MEIKSEKGIKLKKIKSTDKGYDVSYETTNPIHKTINTIFADEGMIVLKGETVSVKIVPLEVPEECLCFLDCYVRHPMGNVIMLVEDPQKKVEEPRTVTHAIFHGMDDGQIGRGDVIGVVDFILAEIFKIETEEFERIRERLKKIKDMTL